MRQGKKAEKYAGQQQQPTLCDLKTEIEKRRYQGHEKGEKV